MGRGVSLGSREGTDVHTVATDTTPSSRGRPESAHTSTEICLRPLPTSPGDKRKTDGTTPKPLRTSDLSASGCLGLGAFRRSRRRSVETGGRRSTTGGTRTVTHTSPSSLESEEHPDSSDSSDSHPGLPGHLPRRGTTRASCSSTVRSFTHDTSRGPYFSVPPVVRGP